ncbi:erythrocyte membrane protein 1, PfEMP1 [Plasmodium sp. gorilla clade G1]|nr:erythrocyte membrane protein 1, PfEMP1 [Plasmodium sp. gorilla clade G1]
MAPSSPATSNFVGNRTARDILETLASDIKRKAIAHAEKYRDHLRGNLSKAQLLGARLRKASKKKYNSNPCDLYYRWYASLGSELLYKRDPCQGKNPKRFDENELSECGPNIHDYKNDNDGGACAPPRRRHLCYKNLEDLTAENTTNSHDLLGNVLLTAIYEGQSIVNNHPHKETSDICTALARSFADIGDIVRGKDLYLGNSKEKEKLQKNLQKIFEKLKIGNTDLQELSDDEIREYWWALNRNDVWIALTCEAPQNVNYFTKDSERTKLFTSQGKCGHNETEVPINLDYVPQFLRWYDEWTEEFCRIKQLKLENVRTRCRGEKDGEKYCSSNGCDCEETINRLGLLRYGNGCTKCLFGCNRYVDWINNKKEEFIKQKQNYVNEINTNNKGQKNTSRNINNIYYEEFYQELNRKYKNVDEFLNILNEETKCKNIDEEDNESKIDFNNDASTFSRSKYCKPCPPCGVEKDNEGKFIERDENNDKCKYENPYKPSGTAEPTDIDVLYFGEEHDEIEINLRKFFDSTDETNSKLIEQWKCYYEDHNNEACILDKKELNKIDKIQKPFYDFFDCWVVHMLKNFIYWRKKLNNCLKNSKATKCNTACEKSCNFFEKWLVKKKQEWSQIKVHYKKQYDLVDDYHFSFFEKFLEVKFLELIEEAYDDTKEITRIVEMLDKKNMQNDGILKDENDIIDILLEDEKKEAESCIKTPTKGICLAQPDDYEEDEELPRQNPCGQYGGSKPTKSVKHVAENFKFMASKDAIDRSLSKLTADAKQGKYTKGGKGEHLHDTFYNLNIHYSNSTKNSKKPCHGKDEKRLNIGTEWKDENFINKKYPGIYMPPRRQHMCTSNLEHLETTNSPLDDTSGDSVNGRSMVNDSFLGDVLLSAKTDADNIKELYKNQIAKSELKDPKDKETICRAVRYSFADLGDIIKGTDMWDLNDGEKKTQDKLVKIFEKIKEQLKDALVDKYDGDKDDKKYINLRKDWWEANRYQIWKAMQHSLKDLKISTGDCSYSQRGVTPYDDYIPQRLRWMTEWAEWYCRVQKEAYEELKGNCEKCKQYGIQKCTRETQECTKCIVASDVYKKKIKAWGDQWGKMEKQYQILYKKAEINAINGAPDHYKGDVQEKDKAVIDFLYNLYLQNGGKRGPPPDTHMPRVKELGPHDIIPTVYSTAEGYVHQELPNMGCISQTQFCRSGDNDNNYAFRHKPKDYDLALRCVDRSQKVVKPKTTKKKATKDSCDTVDELLKKGLDRNGAIDHCNPKKRDKNGKYAEWNCDADKFERDHKGACMPPRRQKLCLYNLKESKQTGKEEQLREAFIKCAAKEVYWLWKKYKEDIENEQTKGLTGVDIVDPQKKLESGTIPEDFKRIMYYTYGDYRDFFFGTDISKNNENSDVQKVKNNINKLFPNTTSSSGKKRQQWWVENAKAVWEGMVCGLSHHIKNGNKEKLRTKLRDNNQYTKFSSSLEDFAKRSPFLRWFTEWGDQFCTEQKKQLNILKGKCPEETCNGDNGKQETCKSGCETYKSWLKDWKDKYNKQSEKYFVDKSNNVFDNTAANTEVKSSSHAYYYLQKALKKLCSDGTCSSCMDKESESTSKQHNKEAAHLLTNHNSSMPASLDDTPSEYKQRCECLEAAPMKVEEKKDSCIIVGEIIQPNHGNKAIGICKPKTLVEYPPWECGNITLVTDENTCMPPRRQKLCLFYLADNNEQDKIHNQDDLREAFIKTAAAETFLAWHYYKSKNDNVASKLDQELEKGQIPPEFFRSMFYTYGDYRNIFFDTDISEKTEESHVKKAIDCICKFFPSPEGKIPGKLSRDEWWQKYGGHIWEGMLCALEKVSGDKVTLTKNIKYDYSTVKFSDDNSAPTLEKFAERPQFLRWMTEWGDEFCREQSQKYNDLKGKCEGYKCNDKNGKKEQCENACKAYKQLIEKWKPQWKIQSDKYEKVYTKATTNSSTSDSDETEKTLLQYLKEHKDPSGNNNKYSTAGKYMNEKGYIKDCQEQKNFGNDEGDKKYTFKDCPNDHEDKCNCKVDVAPSEVTQVSSVKPTQKNNACTSVEKLFEDEMATNFEQVCTQKYGSGKYPGWKCNSSATKTGDKDDRGAVCIPPRRQKLYLKYLQEFTGGTSQEALRKAFIECSAVETFFLWRKFKKDKEKKKTPAQNELILPSYPNFDEEDTTTEPDPQNELNSGTIPEEFKRHMFYTFGDYRDIFFGKDMCNDVGALNEKINTIVSTNGKLNSVQVREEWWKTNGPHIWDGMLCALSYKSYTPIMDAKLRTELTNKNDYNNVTISSVGPSGDNTTTLSDFAKIPQFFRWLEEWGEEFCKKRTYKLEKIEKECHGLNHSGNKKYCSGDGYDCERTNIDRNDIDVNLDCPRCGEECIKYKKWIKNKENEFNKQKNKYGKEHERLKDNSNNNEHDRKFYAEKIQKNSYSSVEKFLASVNNCKHDQGNKDKKNKIEFNNKKTFSSSEYCKACPVYGVKCNRTCTDIDESVYMRTKGSEKKENDKGTTDIDILVLGRNGNDKDINFNNQCNNSILFEESSLQKWNCQRINGVHQCKLTNFVVDIDDDQDIVFNEFFQRWLRYFLQDYNKLKNKIHPCIKKENGKENKCIKGCKENLECVKKWLEIKEGEWKNIKAHYGKHSNISEQDMAYRIKNYFHQLYFDKDATKAQDVVEDEDQKKKDELWGCTGANIKEGDENKCDNGNFIKNLIAALKDKIQSSKQQDDPSDKPDQTCEENLPPLDDDPEPEPEEDPDTSITSSPPDFCKNLNTPDGTESPIDTEESEVAKKPHVTKEEEEGKEEETDKGDEEEEEEEESDGEMYEEDSDSETEDEDQDAPVSDSLPPSEPRPKQLPRDLSPELKKAMLSSTIMWSVGISFAAISYFLLKKKPKSPVDLLRVLDIHKGDYGIPTPKSSNRYIPYVSDTYKGKTYIYMEGDSDEDKYAFMSDTTDVTSSESEYEEMDINDIYVPGSPKYKTLIEVVLEPSKSNGNTVGDDMVPTTNTFTDEEWNELKHDFISQYLPNTESNNNYRSGDIPMSTEPNTLYFDKPEEKPFITSIHDRDLYTGEEINYNINMVNNDIPISARNDSYSGIDLINDSLSGGEPIDIYDELLKRKENELFGTKHPKRTSNNSVAKNTNNDPIMNQLDLLHKWLDRHRDMCEKWNNKEELLDKLNEQWNKDNNVGDIPNDNKTLNTNVSFEIDMDNPKPINQFNNMDTILDDIEDDIYYDVNDENPSVDDIRMDHNKVDVPKKVHVEMKILNNTSNGSLEPEFPISDVWNI